MKNRKQAVAIEPTQMEASTSSLGDRKMEQIRDILFGGLSREYDRRFQELGDRLSQEISRMDGELERRLAAMDARLEATCERMIAQVRQETDARAAALDDLDTRLGQAMRTQRGELASSIGRVEQDLAEADSRAREALAGLRAEAMAAIQAVRESLASERERLQSDKIGREDLADMMGELSMRLRGTLSFPHLD